MINCMCMTCLWCVICLKLSLHTENRSFRVLYFEKKKFLKLCMFWYNINSMVIFIPEIKWNCFQRFATNLNIYVYRTKGLPKICSYGTKLIWTKICIRSCCDGNITFYCNFRNFNIYLQERSVVEGKPDDAIVFWWPLLSRIR